MRLLKFVLTFVFLLAIVLSVKAGDRSSQFRAPNNHVYVIAHRGAHNGIPENSLAAYQKAIDLGCDYVEIDVRTTKDGKFVSVHNSKIDGYVNGITGNVKDFTLAELETLDIGEKIGPEWKNTRIPTFEEILKLCKGKIGIYLDLKDAPVPELMKLIKKYQMERDVVWYITANYLMKMENVNKVFGHSFIMPDPGSDENLNNVLTNLKPVVIATDMDVLSRSFVDKAHGQNAKVFVDEKEGIEAEWSKILGLGTDGIQTDVPEKLIGFLKSRY